jgi:ribose transport system permease protein
MRKEDFMDGVGKMSIPYFEKKKLIKKPDTSFMEHAVVRNVMPFAGFLFIVILFAVLTGGQLFTAGNLKLLLSQSYVLLIACVGVFMVMTMGGLDFSQGSMLGICSVVICFLSNFNIVLAVLCGVITGGIIGLVNGFFNVKRKITSFIVTICNMYLLRGMVAYATTKSPVYGAANITTYNTMAFNLTFTIVIMAVAFCVFQYTGLGNRLKAIGAGETAARFAGVRVEKTKMLVYMAAGMITGLAAFINSIKVGSVTSTAGNQLETQIMIALVLGGMPVNGGAKVKFYNIILGALTYKILTAGLVMLGIEPKTQQLIMGIVFLVMVGIFADRETGMIVK